MAIAPIRPMFGLELVGRLTEPYLLLWHHREVLLQVVRTTLRQRNAGSLIGRAWIILGPLLLIAIYSFMFIFVLSVRPPGLNVPQYVVHMTCGLFLFITVNQGLSTAAGSLSQDPGLLFNQVFPAELFPIREVLAAAVLLMIGLVCAPFWGMASNTIGWAWLLLPAHFIFTLMALAGCAWIVSLAGLVVRDTQQILAYLLTILMLTSPIAFEANMLPASARLLIDANPFAYFVSALQEIVVHGQAPKAYQMAVIAATGVLAFHLGYELFRRGKSVIAENI